MVTELPVPIRFSLPPGWEPVHPDDFGAPHAAIAAVWAESVGSGFTTNLLVHGELRNGGITEDGLADLADETVRGSDDSVTEVEVVHREAIGSSKSPSLVQIVRCVLDDDGVAHELVVLQLLATTGRWERPRRSAIVRAYLTCPADRFEAMAEHFDSFLQSLDVVVPPPSVLPVPVRFELPRGWEAVPPATLGAAFAAMRTSAPDSGFTPIIALDGQFREDGVTGMADEWLRGMRAPERDDAVASREEIGSPERPGLTQAVSEYVFVDGRPRELTRFQVYLTMGHSFDRRRAAVVRATLTCTDDHVDEVLEDFHAFLDTLAPDDSAGAVSP
jgi:hypothetical protein